MAKTSYELVSFDICPFVQKARILFAVKGLEVPTRIIDLDDKPDWFLERCPTGKVPVLLHGDATIFESSVILEYVEDTTETPRLPTDALERARERAWSIFADDLIMAQYRVLSAKTMADFDTQLDMLSRGLAKLEEVASSRPGELRFLECAIAPVFSRIDTVPELREWFADQFPETSGVSRWSSRILSSAAVTGSLPDRFSERLATFFGKRGAFLFA